jgi:hypothetical protein
MSEDEFIEMPQPLGLFAGDLFARGVEYLTAFKRLTEGEAELLPHASYFSCTHAIELLLKSYLAAQGVSKKELRQRKFNLVHDLPNILGRCQTLSMPHVQDLDRLVDHLHEMNKDHDFRYPRGYKLELPPIAKCLKVADELKETIQPIITSAQLSASIHFAADTREHRGKKVRWSD